jgi:hypothetical protein
MVREAQEKNGNEVFTRQQAKKLLNRESYNEYVQQMADYFLKDLDERTLEPDFEPELDL